MSSAKSSQTILISGGSGFVAAHVLNSFLEAGYKVRTTVRSQAKEEGIKKTHAKYASNLSFAIVPDIAAPCSFDEAVKGVDGVIHTASPFVTSGIKDNDKELLRPAIDGTEEILKAIAKNAPQVKRVVITSSFAAIIDLSKAKRPGYTYTEKDWNPVTYEEAKVSENGSFTYCASKAFAEKAAFDFVKEKKPNFTVSTICPPMIYGPPVHHITSLESLNTSMGDIYRLCNGSLKEVPPTRFFAYADVRDVADAHLKAYELAEDGRFFVVAEQFTYQQFCNIIRKNFPEKKDATPEGNPDEKFPDVYGVDNTKSVQVLGIKYRTKEETIVDTVQRLIEVEKESKA